MTAVIERLNTPGTISRLLPSDVTELLAMYDRCSPDTTFRRWHGHVHAFPATYLSAMLATNDEHIAVAAHRDARMIGFASAAETAPGTREIGVLVEDRWQRRGVGRQLIASVVGESKILGTRFLQAEVLAEDAWLIDVLRAFGPTSARPSFGIVAAQVRVVP
jgi:GNAT superfamily N-acetyltransferase